MIFYLQIELYANYINQKVGYLPITVEVWRVHRANASHKDLEKNFENTKKNHLYGFCD